MKRFLFLALFTFFISANAFSQTGTHYTDGPIVDKLKAAVAAYNEGDWTTYRSFFADTARIHVNSPEPANIDERIAEMKEGLKAMESYELMSPVYGHIKTAEGVDWGMIWGGWQGKAGGEEWTVMVHSVTRYVDGLAVEQWGFWDTAQGPQPPAQTEEE